jgi:hypothetical protein
MYQESLGFRWIALLMVAPDGDAKRLIAELRRSQTLNLYEPKRSSVLVTIKVTWGSKNEPVVQPQAQRHFFYSKWFFPTCSGFLEKLINE